MRLDASFQWINLNGKNENTNWIYGVIDIFQKYLVNKDNVISLQDKSFCIFSK